MTWHTSRRNLLRTTGAAAGAVGLSSLAGCMGTIGGGSGVKVGSKQFSEQRVLGSLAYETLSENTDLEISDETGLGGTTQNFEALRSEEIDLYWEYTGTAWLTLPPQHDDPIADSDEIHSEVKQQFESEHGVTVLDYAPLDNTYVLTANPDWHEETGVDSLSELAAHVNDGNTDLDQVMNAEFSERDDGWSGLVEHYDFDDDAVDDLAANTSTVDDEVVYQVVGEGEAEIGMGFNTDPRILQFDLHVFEDDEDFFPAYNAAPLVREELLEESPEIEDVLNELTPLLDTDTIREMNNEVANEDRNPQNVASEFLEDEGLI